MILLCNIYKNIEILKFFLEHYFARNVDKIIFGVWQGENNPHWDYLKSIESDRIVILRGVMNHVWSGNQADADVHDAFRQLYIPKGEWYVIADLDEFHDVNNFENLAKEAHDFDYVDSVLVDRVAPGGIIPLNLTDLPLKEQFPLSLPLTHKIVRGHPRKIVIARQHVPVTNGHHRLPKKYRKYPKSYKTLHYKWYGDMIWALKERQEFYLYERVKFADEPTRLLAHIEKHHGKLM